jgi:hypothetical protein
VCRLLFASHLQQECLSIDDDVERITQNNCQLRLLDELLRCGTCQGHYDARYRVLLLAVCQIIGLSDAVFAAKEDGKYFTL